MNKIIFLDIDGVLNNDEHLKKFSRSKNPMDHIMPEKVKLLNSIIKDTSAKIVLSTGWRVVLGAAETADVLLNSGLEGSIVGSTPDLPRRFSEVIPRWKEIQTWINQNKNKIANFVILDDLEFASNDKLSKNFILTDSKNGLTEADVTKAILILKG